MKNTLKFKPLLTFMVVCLTMSASLFSQEVTFREKAGTGTWQYHLPLHLGKKVALAGDKVYCAAAAGLYYFEKEFESINEISKQDGLNNVEVSSFGYYGEMNLLLLAYKNTNIDIIQGNEIINMNDIYRKQIIGEKEINGVYFYERKAYLACSFGVVVIDLDKLEVVETYQSLGESGEVLRVNDLCIQDSTLYLATEEGVLYGAIAPGVNLLDFNNWNRYSAADGVPVMECSAIAGFEGSIYAYYADTVDTSTYQLKNQLWELDTRFANQLVDFNSDNGNRLIATYHQGFYALDAEGNFTEETNDGFKYLEQVIYDPADDVYWGADAISGLIQYNYQDSTVTQFKPNSPGNSAVFELENINGKIYALAGGHDGSFTQLGRPMQWDILSDYGWNSKTQQYSPGATLYSVTDAQTAAFNPENNKVYFGTHGYGVVEDDGSGEFVIYNDSNSNLVNVLEEGPYVRVMDMDVDNDGNLWVANYIETKSSSKASFHSFSAAGEWKSYPIPEFKGVGYPTKILADQNGYVWAILAQKFGGGMVVFEPDGQGGIQDGHKRLLTAEFEEGQLPDRDVRCMVEDLGGEIWVGTIDGLGAFYFPFAMFDDDFGNTDAAQTIIDGRPVLEGEVVNCIAIDAGNRKWVGTPNGVWLFDASVNEVIHNFTEENSPLPSDYIVDIEIDHATGEVFIATDLGLVSYRGDATTGFVECQDNINVFPNPVEPTFNGQMAVSGLTNGAEIKILDMAGNLAWETEANGGGFSWDCRDYNGERVASGIYQIVVYGGNKKRSCITRVAILN